MKVKAPMVTALREGDYSIRARGADYDDAYGVCDGYGLIPLGGGFNYGFLPKHEFEYKVARQGPNEDKPRGQSGKTHDDSGVAVKFEFKFTEGCGDLL